jgi:4-hydroxy-3-polyprenylbenzoate decarboxylase
MIINACRPFSWRDEFVTAVKPSAEMMRRAREKFDWLLD